MEPKPISPSRGSGEAVCGRPSFLAVVLVSAAFALAEAAPADWSLLCAGAALWSAAAAPVELVADWSAEGVVVAAADWSLLGVALGVVAALAPAAD